MGNYVDPKEERKVDLGGGESAWLPARLDFKTLRSMTEHFESGDNVAAACMVVRRWDVKGPDGEVLPINADTLQALHWKAATVLLNAAQAVFEESHLPKAQAGASGKPSGKAKAARK